MKQRSEAPTSTRKRSPGQFVGTTGMITATLFLLVGGCSEKSEYDRMVERELASGETHNELFLGYELGMSRQEFYDHSWNLNRQELVMQGPQNQTVQYELGDELPHDGKMFFYPDFHEDTVYQMRVHFLYDGWAPWNKDLWADSLLLHVLDMFERWYGDGFLERYDDQRRLHFVKVDGNRRIVVGTLDDSNVGAVFTDLHTEREVEQVMDAVDAMR